MGGWGAAPECIAHGCVAATSIARINLRCHGCCAAVGCVAVGALLGAAVCGALPMDCTEVGGDALPGMGGGEALRCGIGRCAARRQTAALW